MQKYINSGLIKKETIDRKENRPWARLEIILALSNPIFNGKHYFWSLE